MSSNKTVEALLQEAIRRGDFNDLPGRGKPVDLSDYFNAPEDLRMAYSILRNAGILPEEVELKNRVSLLKEQLFTCTNEEERSILQKKLAEDLLKFNLIMDSRKRKQVRI